MVQQIDADVLTVQEYMMEHFKKQLESDHVKILSLEEGDMNDNGKFLNRFYRKMQRSKDMILFSCATYGARKEQHCH